MMSKSLPPDTFREFLASIDADLSATENRLGLSEGTLKRLLGDTDCLAVVKMIATIEPTVNELIELGFTQPHGGLGGKTNKTLFGDAASFLAERLLLNGRAGKLQLANRLGMLDGDDVTFAEALSAIRNRYAHNVKNVNRELIELYDEASKNDGKLLEKLTYGMVKPVQKIEGKMLKLMVIWGFSRFLSKAEAKHVALKGGLMSLLGFMEQPEQAQ